MKCGNVCPDPGCAAVATSRRYAMCDPRRVLAPRSVSSAARKAMRNALEDCGPVVSLKRRGERRIVGRRRIPHESISGPCPVRNPPLPRDAVGPRLHDRALLLEQVVDVVLPRPALEALTGLHQCSPLLEEIAARAGDLGPVPDHMRKRRLHDRVRRMGSLDGGARKSPAPTRVPKALKVLPSIT